MIEMRSISEHRIDLLLRKTPIRTCKPIAGLIDFACEWPLRQAAHIAFFPSAVRIGDTFWFGSFFACASIWVVRAIGPVHHVSHSPPRERPFE